MPKRSRPNKVADGHKSIETKLDRFGPKEINREWDMARWTRANGMRAENPYRKENYYTPAHLVRAREHAAWQKANPGKTDNPYSWKPEHGLGVRHQHAMIAFEPAFGE